MKNFLKVFSFTLKQQFKLKSFLSLMIILAVLLFAGPVLALTLMEKNSGKEEEEPERMLETVYVVPETGTVQEWSTLEMLPLEGFEKVKLVLCETVEAAQKALGEDSHGILIKLQLQEDQYLAKLLLPEDTEVSYEEAAEYGSAFAGSLSMARLVQLGMDPTLLGILIEAPEVSMEGPSAGMDGDSTEEDYSGIHTAFAMVLPYLNIMVIYFMVLAFGQNVGNSVIIEKTSKLMDTFLVSVKPREMILGKLLAIWSCAVIQLFVWGISLFAGFRLGIFLVYRINPDSSLPLLQVLALLKEASGMFTVSGILVGMVLLFLGLLLYCGLSAVGGALASKPEELANTNSIFTIVLLISFLSTLYSGFLSREVVRGMSWVDLVPFTSVLITPARLVLGYLTPAQGLISGALILVMTLIAAWIAGELYTMLSLYKGKTPKPSEIITLIKNNRKKN